MKKRLIPFRYTPAAWGLDGDSFKRAEIEYHYEEGEERDRKLAEIDHRTNPDELARQTIRLDLKYGRVTPHHADVRLAEIDFRNRPEELQDHLVRLDQKHGVIDAHEADSRLAKRRWASQPKTLQLRLAEIDHLHGKITAAELEKTRATLKDEPYITVTKSEYNPKLGVNGLYFEFDWNNVFIDTLKAAGYVGFTDEQIVNDWFTHLCQSIAEDAVEEAEANGAFDDLTKVRTKIVRRDDGLTEHS